MNQQPINLSNGTQQQILDFCRHIAGSAQITAISTLGNYPPTKPSTKTTLEIVLVIHGFQPRLMRYLKTLDGTNLLVIAVDQWVFERDVERGFLGEAIASTLIFPYTSIHCAEYLRAQEIILKKRLILELLENLVLSFPELSHHLRIKPEYFMYEVMVNRVRIFPPLAYGLSNFMNGNVSDKEVNLVFQGYMEALKQLEKEEKINFSEDYVLIPKKFVSESQTSKVRFMNISRNAPRTLFTSLFQVFPQLMNFFSQNTEPLLSLQNFTLKKKIGQKQRLIDPQKYVFVPTSNGLVSLADRVDIEAYARKMLLNSRDAKIEFEEVGGVLNDVYLIKAYPNGLQKKVLVKRFKDWSGFKWFPLSLWSFGTRTFAVLGRYRLAKECAISELLYREGFNVPRILHVSHNERLVFMEYIEGENLSNAIKRVATSKNPERAEKDLNTIMRVGETLAKVHSHNVGLGDTKPENVIISPKNEVYLLDFEQASREGDKAWDIAVFLYYSGHYLQPLYSNGKAEAIAIAFIRGYLNGGGDFEAVKKAGTAKYTRIFSVFTMPSIIAAMSNVCRETEALK